MTQPPAQVATWYARGLKKPDAHTAASRVHPRGTWLVVRHRACWVNVRVNDYGPELGTGADIDLSRGAFLKLAPLSTGRIFVSVEVLQCWNLKSNERPVIESYASWEFRTSRFKAFVGSPTAVFSFLAGLPSSSSSNAPAKSPAPCRFTFTPSFANSAIR